MNALLIVDSMFLMETMDTGVEYKTQKLKEHNKNILRVFKYEEQKLYAEVIESKGIYKVVIDLRGPRYDAYGFTAKEKLTRYQMERYKSENQVSVFNFEFRSPQQMIKFCQRCLF